MHSYGVTSTDSSYVCIITGYNIIYNDKVITWSFSTGTTLLSFLME